MNYNYLLIDQAAIRGHEPAKLSLMLLEPNLTDSELASVVCVVTIKS